MRKRTWDDDTFYEAIQKEHLDFVNQQRERISNTTLISYIRDRNTPLTSELGRRSKKSRWKGEILEKCGISPWLHYAEKRPLGRTKEESEKCLMHLWTELKHASEELRCNISLSKRLEHWRIPAPEHFHHAKYRYCQSCKCNELFDDSITAGAAIKTLKKELGANWKEILEENYLSGKNGVGLLDEQIKGISIRTIAVISYAIELDRRTYKSGNVPDRIAALDRLILTSNEKELDGEAVLSLMLGKKANNGQHVESPSSNNEPIMHVITSLLSEDLGSTEIKERLSFCYAFMRGEPFEECIKELRSCTGSGAIQKARRLSKEINEHRAEFLLRIIYDALTVLGKTELYLLRAIQIIHDDWTNLSSESGTRLDTYYIRSKNKEIGNWISGRKEGIREILRKAGINPECHSAEISYGSTIEEEKRNAVLLIKAMAAAFGSHNLNPLFVGVNNRETEVYAPWLSEKKSLYPTCEKAGCKIIHPKAGAIFARCTTLFGSWEKAVNEAGFYYQESVLKKKHRVSKHEVISQFIDYTEANEDWTVAKLKEEAKTLYKNCYNKRDQGQLVFADIYRGDTMRAIYAEAAWIQADTTLDAQDFLESNKEEIDYDWQQRRNFDDTTKARGRLFEAWFAQQLVQSGFNEALDLSNLDSGSFMHNKAINVNGILVRPDFVFKDFLIDTKTTYFKYQRRTINQFATYSLIRDRMYCITSRQNFRHAISDRVIVDVVSMVNAPSLIEELREVSLDQASFEIFIEKHKPTTIKD